MAPFSRLRSGTLLFGEGAAVLVLEDLESADREGTATRALCSGAGYTCDAMHVTAPDESGASASRVMRDAVEDAGLSADAIDYINLHGSGTVANDAMESAAIQEVFGPAAASIAASSIKAATGHAMGAAGAIEALATVLAVEYQLVPPTVNVLKSDCPFPLDLVCGTAQARPIRNALPATLSGSAAATGRSSSRVSTNDRRALHPAPGRRHWFRLPVSMGVRRGGAVGRAARPARRASATGALSKAYGASDGRLKVARWLDPVAENAILAVGRAIREAALSDEQISVDPYRCGVVCGTQYGPIEARRQLHDSLIKRKGRSVSATFFSHCGYNMAAAMTAVAFGLKGPNLTVSARPNIDLHARRQAVAGAHSGGEGGDDLRRVHGEPARFVRARAQRVPLSRRSWGRPPAAACGAALAIDVRTFGARGPTRFVRTTACRPSISSAGLGVSKRGSVKCFPWISTATRGSSCRRPRPRRAPTSSTAAPCFSSRPCAAPPHRRTAASTLLPQRVREGTIVLIVSALEASAWRGDAEGRT